ncbi:MAG: hypothetical protein R3E79_14280 [Caldilineaceae bacterium]
MQVDNAGYLYVAEQQVGTRVIKLEVKPNNVLSQVTWSLQPNPDPPLGFYSMAIQGDNLYITGDVYHRIWQFGLDGTYRRSWGGQSTNHGQISDPRGLAISPLDDALYMADCETGRINKVVEDRIVQSWDAEDLGIAPPRPLFCPIGLTFDRRGACCWLITTIRLPALLPAVGS